MTKDKQSNIEWLRDLYKKRIKRVSINAPNLEVPKYIIQTWTNIKGEMDNNANTVGDFNTPNDIKRQIT